MKRNLTLTVNSYFESLSAKIMMRATTMTETTTKITGFSDNEELPRRLKKTIWLRNWNMEQNLSWCYELTFLKKIPYLKSDQMTT